jgi:hypothetical protein
MVWGGSILIMSVDGQSPAETGHLPESSGDGGENDGYWSPPSDKDNLIRLLGLDEKEDVTEDISPEKVLEFFQELGKDIPNPKLVRENGVGPLVALAEALEAVGVAELVARKELKTFEPEKYSQEAELTRHYFKDPEAREKMLEALVTRYHRVTGSEKKSE